MKDLDFILSKLPNLTQKELAQVRATADHLIKSIQGADPTVLVWDVLMKVLNGKMTFAALKNMSAYKQWKQHAPGCLTFVGETFPVAKRSRVTEMAILQFLLEALRDSLKAGHIPVTVGTMITHMGRVPQVFEQSFPDYRESGLADLVLRSMQKKNR